ncbi:MAG TPA: sugar phosphate isomerase/epimerase [Gemmatimonadales bacterium]|nr:sugar phosphate isomerase/epimerase [Gemmatimonadales bacterium]
MNRRHWLEATGRAAGASALAALLPAGVVRSALVAGPRKLDRIGLQLYTVRSLMDPGRGPRSVEETLDRVARIGYREVQFAGYFGRTPQQIRAALDASGLQAPGSHIPFPALRDRWAGTVEAGLVMGHRYLLVAWIPPEERRTIDGYKRVAELFNRAAEQARTAGLLFAYHNHDYEFTQLDGEIPYDVLLAATDPGLVKAEMDLFWIRRGGQDPLQYFARYPGRFHSVHVKDMDRAGKMVDVGKGVIDFAAIFRHMDQAGIRHFFVEHDSPPDPFASIGASYQYLRQLDF